MRMQKIEGTERVDEATGKPVATYLFDNGEEMDMSDEDYNRLVGTTPAAPAAPEPATPSLPDNFSVDLGTPAYQGLPTQLPQTASPTGMPAPVPSAIGGVTAGLLGVTPETLQASGTPTPTPGLVTKQPPLVGPPLSAKPAPEPVPAPVISDANSAMTIPVSPAMATTTQMQSEWTSLPAAVKDRQSKLFDKQLKAVDAAADAELELNRLEGERLKQEADAIQTFNENREIERVYQEKQRQDLKDRLAAATAKYEGAEIDSGRYWANKSTGSKILSAIAIGLGAYAQSMGANRENPALTMLRAAIDNDIKAQEANMAKAGKYVDTVRGLYSDLVKEFEDKELAALKTHEMGLKQASLAAQAAATKAKNPVIKNNADASKAAIEQELVNNQIKQEAVINRKVTETVPIKPDKPVEVPGTVGAVLRDAASRYDVWDELEKNYSAIDSKRLEEIAGPIDQAQQDIYKFLGWEVPEDAASLRAETDIARFKFVKAMTGAGVNVQELKQYEKILPSLKSNPKTALAIIRKLKQDELSAFKKIAVREMSMNEQYAPSIMRAYGHMILPQQQNVKDKYNVKTPGK